MDLTQYVTELRDELAVAAEAGGEEARALAGRLTAPLEPAVRLMLLEALSAAADEISRELSPGSVELRLRSGEPEFVVAAAEPLPELDPAPSAPPDVEDGETVRINLRLPESLKNAAEAAAARERLSVNAWLVRVVATAVGPGGGDRRPRPRGAQTYKGWVR